MKYFAILLLALMMISGCVQKPKKSVLIQPYGDIDQTLVEEAKKSIQHTYGFDVFIAARKAIPGTSFVNIKSPRYRADSILRIQKRNKPDSIDFILGLTNLDISTTKKDAFGNILKPASRYADWGVFGLGYRPGCSSIISTFRLGTSDHKLLLERIKKVCNHELGHNFGLPHCTSSETCVLRDAAETIKTVDDVADTLCHVCKGKI